jgi:hypothetical protein
MAFFGITALGPQNCFANVEKNSRIIQIFEESDFLVSWNKVIGRDIHVCMTHKLEAILRDIFHGSIPVNDRESIETAFAKYSSTITKEDFIKEMNRLKDEAEEFERNLQGKPKPSCEFSSSSEYQQSITALKPLKRTLQQKQTAPLTAMQEV